MFMEYIYVHGSGERVIQATRGDKSDGLEAARIFRRDYKIRRKMLQTKEVRSEQI